MLFLQLSLKLWSHQISWGTSSCDPVRSHKLNRLGQLKLWWCQISSAKQVWDESVLEQGTCNEQVGFKGHRGCDNSTKVGDVPCSLIDLKQKFCTHNKSHCWKTVLRKSGGWNWGTSPNLTINYQAGKDICAFFFFFFVPIICVSQKEIMERNIWHWNGWVWSKSFFGQLCVCCSHFGNCIITHTDKT